MGLYKRNKVWWFTVNVQGRQYRQSTGTSNRRLAEAIHGKVLVKIQEGRFFEVPEESSRTFLELLERYDQEHVPKKANQRAIRGNMKNLGAFFGNRYLEGITPQFIVRYKNKRYADGVKPATINRELATMKHAYNLAIREWEWTQRNPVKSVSFEEERNKRFRWLSHEEEARLLPQCAVWVKEIVVFALHTGMRMGEILGITWEAVDLFRKTVVLTKTKNAESRTVPLNRVVVNLLKQKNKVRSIRTNLVFHSQTMTAIDPHHLGRGFRVALKKANIQDFHFHDLRHTFATRLVQAGIDLYKVQRLLGHKSPVMTQRYAHHFTDSLRDGVEILEQEATGITNLSHSQAMGV